MGSKIEVVDGVRGEWRSVTKAEEVNVGQRVRYYGDEIGCDGKSRFVQSTRGGCVETWDGEDVTTGAADVLKFFKGTVQAFFPVAEKKQRKVAKVDVGYYFSDGHFSDGWQWSFASSKMVEIRSYHNYTTRAHAIRGARRFCKTIGFECEIVN